MKALTNKNKVLHALVYATILVVGLTAWGADINLVLWWKLDEGSGTTVADASGNGHGGTLQGDPLPIWTNGVVSGGLNFTDDHRAHCSQ